MLASSIFQTQKHRGARTWRQFVREIQELCIARAPEILHWAHNAAIWQEREIEPLAV